MKKSTINRSKHLTIRLTTHEKHIIADNARKSNLKMSKYIRYKLFNHSVILDPQQVNDEMRMATLNDQLSGLESKYQGVGHNLNQVVKETHIVGLQPELIPLINEIKATRKLLQALDEDVQKLKF